MDILGIFGFVFAATAFSVLVYEYQSDVLYGPYIQGRAEPRMFAMFDPVVARVAPIFDRINWQARNAIYLASLA
jgi:hypothetical protein